MEHSLEDEVIVMGTGSSKNDDVVAFDIGSEVKEIKKQNNNNKNNSWESETKKEEKSLSRLGVSTRK